MDELPKSDVAALPFWKRTFPWGPLLLVTVACNVVAWLVAAYRRPVPGAFGRWVDAWAHWDSGWYAQIAEGGYSAGGSVAFFPVYPLSLRALTLLGLEVHVAGIALALFSGALATVLFHLWAKTLLPEGRAHVATALLLLFPFSFYLRGAMYSDALFLLLVVAAFYSLEKNLPWRAILLGALATAGRPVAPAVVAGLLARQLERSYLQHGKIRWRDGWMLLSSAGLLLWMAFLYSEFGDPLAFMHVQASEEWKQAQGWQTWLKMPLWHWMFERFRPGLILRTAVHAGIAFGVLWTTRPLWRHYSRGYAVYVFCVMGLPVLASKDFNGLARYALAAFPAFVPLAHGLEGKPKTTRATLALFGMGLLVLTGVYASDFYLS